MTTSQALARAAITALVDREVTFAHWWGAMEPAERDRVEAHCAAALERERETT